MACAERFPRSGERSYERGDRSLTMINRRPTSLTVLIWVAIAAYGSRANAQEVEADTRDSTQHVVVVLDDSGSMNEPMRRNRRMTKMQAAKQSLITVLDSLPADAHVGVVALNARNEPHRGNNWIIPLGPVDKAQATAAIRSLRANGGTPLGHFMRHGADELLKSRSKDRYGSYRLLIVTDGEAGDQASVERFLPDILSRGITTDVIGVDMASEHSLATKVHTYRRADDPESLTRAVREVFAETSADASDTGEDDFDLVAGLPDEVAVAALEALGSAGNHPIGTRAGVTGVVAAHPTQPGNQGMGQQPNLPGPPGGILFPQNQNQGQAQDQGGPSMFALLIIGFVLFNLAKAFFGGGKRRRNHY